MVGQRKRKSNYRLNFIHCCNEKKNGTILLYEVATFCPDVITRANRVAFFIRRPGEALHIWMDGQSLSV